MKEPSLYDYLRSLFDPNIHIDLSGYFPKEKSTILQEIKEIKEPPISNIVYWKVILGCGLAIFGQYFLEPTHFHGAVALILYAISFILLWQGLKREIDRSSIEESQEDRQIVFSFHPTYFIPSILFLVIAFFLFAGNLFNWLNISIWLLGISLLIFSLWNPKKRDRIKPSEPFDLQFAIAMAVASLIILFFRLFLLNEIPGEMFSDHAEKLLDVMDVLQGKFPIFLERNTGREPLQFYFTALMIKIFNTKINFISLKIGTVTFGLLTLPFIYLLAKELSNKWGGFFALLLAGIAYWPNVISRVGLRYSLYPLFTAPVMYFLIKGMKEKNTNYLILCGIFLGLGLHGYSSFRIVPVMVIAFFMLYLLFNRNKIYDDQTWPGIFLIAFVSFSIFLPLFRYWFDNSGSFSYRALSRLTQIERPYTEPVILIFIKNLIASITMPFYNNGQIWVHSIPNRPALDILSASSFFTGIIYMVRRIQAEKNWEYAAVLVSIPLLMMPSILSLAYPGENPSLNRSAGALVPIFIVSGIGLNYFIRSVVEILPKRIALVSSIGMSILLVGLSMMNNFQLVFETYRQQFDENSWNSSEIGGVIRDFIQADNDPENAFVIPYPHWVDTRLVGFNADYPGKDYALSRELIPASAAVPGEKLYIFKPEDTETQTELENWFPDGHPAIFYSEVPGKEFIIYTVNEK